MPQRSQIHHQEIAKALQYVFPSHRQASVHNVLFRSFIAML